jgi:hypothetical protein
VVPKFLSVENGEFRRTGHDFGALIGNRLHRGMNWPAIDGVYWQTASTSPCPISIKTSAATPLARELNSVLTQLKRYATISDSPTKMVFFCMILLKLRIFIAFESIPIRRRSKNTLPFPILPKTQLCVQTTRPF